MAKDMSGVYAEMLTKELVMLRRKHQAAVDALSGNYSLRAKRERARRVDLVLQIEHELADRVAEMGLFA